VRAAIAKAADRTSRLHLQHVRNQIARILDPKFAPPTVPLNLPIIRGLDGSDDSLGCWIDYAIRVNHVEAGL
jgi:hypothetical protein